MCKSLAPCRTGSTGSAIRDTHGAIYAPVIRIMCRIGYTIHVPSPHQHRKKTLKILSGCLYRVVVVWLQSYDSCSCHRNQRACVHKQKNESLREKCYLLVRVRSHAVHRSEHVGLDCCMFCATRVAAASAAALCCETDEVAASLSAVFLVGRLFSNS